VNHPRSLATLAALTALFAGALAPTAAADPAALVNPLSGTLGPGFPSVGAGLPFGMIQPGPDTSLSDGSQNQVNYTGYAYEDPDIRGFSLTHFDGAGIHIAGDLPFMPTTGQVNPADSSGNASPYSHASETAQPGYYAVTLARSGIRTELTGTLRAAEMRFAFPSTTQANVLAEVSQSTNGANAGAVNVVGQRELQGWVKSDVGYRVYFDAQFSRPFSAAGTWTGSTLSPGSTSAAGKPVGAYLTFDTTKERAVTMRVAISYVSQAGAAANLAAEIPAGRSFDTVRRAARTAWDRRLSDVGVSGGPGSERRTFYDNLYRSLLLPSVFDDSDGRYLGFDGQIHRVAAGHHQYTNLSLWDVYRSQLPLLELIEPRVAHDVLTSLIVDAEQKGGVIPRWVQANMDRGIMGGDSGSAALADGAIEGLLTPSQTSEALSLLSQQATTLPPVWPREHLDAYLKYGYIPNDIDGIGTSKTLEYTIDDNAVAQLAQALGDGTDADGLAARAGYWRHLVDPSNHFIRPRNSDGSWADSTQLTDPTGITGYSAGSVPASSPDLEDGFQEGTGWQYLWSVPQDVAGLAQAIGGQSVARHRLDRFFATALNSPVAPGVALVHQLSGFFGVYFIGNQYTSVNEPDLWAPWYYDWYGQPWKTQKVARAEMAAYNQTPEGLPGNDDAGEMSAWYVLAALGLYHTTPGLPMWALSSPTFPRATLQVGGRTVDIEAPGADRARPYIHGLTLNGRPESRTFLTTCQLQAGRALTFRLGARPDRSWGSGPGAAPPSESAPSAAVDACAARLALGGSG
jgi:predicted alpha-1,2-mannosidase